MSRAFIFTMDAVLALIPVFILMGSVSILSGGEAIHLQAQTMDLSHWTGDALAVLEKQGTLDDLGRMFANYTKLKKDGDSAWQDERDNLLTLVNTTLSPMIPEYLGYGVDFWGQYPNGTEYIDLEFTTDNRTLAGAERPYENESNSIEAAAKLVSGYEKEKPTKGCIARASLIDLSKTTTKVVSFNPQGSGWGINNVEIEKRFELPSDANITNATFYISIHTGDPDTELHELTVNGMDMRDRISWTYPWQGTGIFQSGAFGVASVTNLITPGTNSVRMVFEHSNFHSHIHPGMRLEITHETAQSQSTSMTQRFYFDSTLGRTGAWQTLDFYVPQGAVVGAATLYLHAEGIDDRYSIEVNGNLVANCFSSCAITYDNTSNIKSYIQNGTNVISAFFDCYGDSQYGSGTAEISNSSYVEIQYASLPQTTYGYLDFTKVLQFGGSSSDPKETSFFIPGTHDPISEAFVHMAQIYSWELRLQAWAQGDSPTTVFESSSPREVPDSVFIDPQILESNQTNYVRATDTGCACDFLPESIIEYTHLTPSLVTFGTVFDDCTGHERTVYYDVDEDEVADGSNLVSGSAGAFNPLLDGKDDALQRLLDELNTYETANASGDSGSEFNPIDIELIDIEFEGEGIGDVPYMWGPLKIRIRIWR